MIRRLLDRSQVRYLVVGGLCAGVNWALMLLVDRDRYLLSSLVLFVPMGTFGFLLHAYWTFREEPSLRSWLAYLIGMLPGSALSLAILAVARDGVGLPLALALPVTVAIMTVANYLVAWCAISGLAPRRFRQPIGVRRP